MTINNGQYLPEMVDEKMMDNLYTRMPYNWQVDFPTKPVK